MKNLFDHKYFSFKKIDIPVRFLLLQIMVLLAIIVLMTI
ncbi:hypothetical protein SAMN06265379_103257 [Saccharicrinis carchari]|uniref:Uncharacterized protein n=1 Tax=Saccharicrinis carchari TaxID=1168039 RepID=A0A521CL47_SACCC|nr:hypothetical protein SAMN06265379_103257 [Saccharicrinis carchari]